jgi:hypothetical protein
MPMAEANPPPNPPSNPAPASGPALAVGQPVRLRDRPAYLKTADPMPMLRPPDLIGPEEVGAVAEVRARGLLAVRFRRGTFLLAASSLEPAGDD